MQINYIPKHLEMFVDLSQPYEKIKFIQANADKKNKDIMWGTFVEDPVPGKPPGFGQVLIENFTGPLFPAFTTLKGNNREEVHEVFKWIDKIRKLVDICVSEQPGFRCGISLLERYLINHGFDQVQTIAALKSLLANEAIYTFEGKGNDGYFKFSKDKANAQGLLIYYKSIADEIKIKSRKISLLVSHGQTVGNYREYILRDLIQKHLPEKFAIATGFIAGFSNQIDILIYDAHNYAPLFKEGDLVVVKQESVRAIIEVKTTLSSKTLKESLEMFHSISLPGYKTSVLPVFKGVFSFETKYKSNKSLAQSIYDFHNKSYMHSVAGKMWTNDILYLFHEISCVATINKHCIFSQYMHADSNDASNIIPYLYSVHDDSGSDVQTIMFISRLFEYLDVRPYAKKDSVWNMSRQLAGGATSIKTEMKLTSDDWFPVSATDREHNFDQESIKTRLISFNQWFLGDIDTDELMAQLTPVTKRQHRVR